MSILRKHLKYLRDINGKSLFEITEVNIVFWVIRVSPLIINGSFIFVNQNFIGFLYFIKLLLSLFLFFFTLLLMFIRVPFNSQFFMSPFYFFFCTVFLNCQNFVIIFFFGLLKQLFRLLYFFIYIRSLRIELFNFNKIILGFFIFLHRHSCLTSSKVRF